MATVGTAVIPWPARLWHRIRAAFQPEVRGRTAEEQALAGRVGQLQEAVMEREAAEVKTLRQDIAEREAGLWVRRREVELLAGVIARARARVAAEVAIANGQAVVPERRG